MEKLHCSLQCITHGRLQFLYKISTVKVIDIDSETIKSVY